MKTLYSAAALAFACILTLGQATPAVDAVTPAADRQVTYTQILNDSEFATAANAINAAIIKADKAIDNAILNANQEIESSMTRAEKAAAAVFAEQNLAKEKAAAKERAARAAAAGLTYNSNATATAGKIVTGAPYEMNNAVDTTSAAATYGADKITASGLPENYITDSNAKTGQAIALILGFVVLAGLLYWASKMSKYNREHPETIRPRDGSTLPQNGSDLNPS